MGCSNPCPPPSSLMPMFVCVFVGVCSAWAVGGVVVMESVLCDLWAGVQDQNQEVCERERGLGLWTAWDSDQTLQHSSVSWLVPSPFTWYTHSLFLCLFSCMTVSSFSSKSQKNLNHKQLGYFYSSWIYMNMHLYFMFYHYSSCIDQVSLSSAKMGTNAAFMSHRAELD